VVKAVAYWSWKVGSSWSFTGAAAMSAVEPANRGMNEMRKASTSHL
jgi:hypothetical protein